MKLKKIVSLALSAALVLSIAAASAFAVESTPSKTGPDADDGETEVSVEDVKVEVKATEASAAEEAKLKSLGVEGYLGASATASAASIVGTTKDNVTINEIKELLVSGYKAEKGSVTLKIPFAALPKVGTQVAVVLRVVDKNSNATNLVLNGVVVEDTVVTNGVARQVRKVQFTLDSNTLLLAQASSKVFVAVVTAK